MVRFCLPSLPQSSFVSYLFSYTSPSPAPLSPSKPQSCDLAAIPYTSWSPPTCPQKCDGVCSHRPVGSDARVDEQLRAGSETEKLSAEEKRRREDIDMMIEAAKESEVGDDVGVSGSGAGYTASPVFVVKTVDGNVTPDLASLFGDEDGDEDGASAWSPSTQSDTHQAMADWLNQLSDADSDDEAAFIGLYDVDLDHDVQEHTHAQGDQRPTHILGSDDEERIERCAPTIDGDAAQPLKTSIDTQHTEGRTLSHIFLSP